MKRPETIPEDVWELAGRALQQAQIKAHMLGEETEPVECIARAILAEREAQKERDAGKLTLSADKIRLHMGELSAQEMRAVKAFINWRASSIRQVSQ